MQNAMQPLIVLAAFPVDEDKKNRRFIKVIVWSSQNSSYVFGNCSD